jgi:hypothetical protein
VLGLPTRSHVRSLSDAGTLTDISDWT